MPTSVVRRPLAGLALCFAAGTLCGIFLSSAPVGLLAAAALLTVLALAFSGRSVSIACLGLAVLAVGWINADLEVRNPSRREIAALVKRPREYVSIIGIVVDDPSVQVGRKEGEVRWTYSLKVEAMQRLESWQKARATVAVMWHTNTLARAPHYGERWELSGLLDAAPEVKQQLVPVAAPTFQVDPAAAVLLSGGHGIPLIAWCLKARAVCFDILGRGLEDYPQHAGLLRALMLGVRQELPWDINRAFATTGTLHVIAISGLHVVVMAVLIIFVLKMFGLSRERWILYLAPALVCYAIATGMYASTLRACVMAILFWSAPFFGRRPDGPSALAAAAMIIVVAAPLQILDAGFLLSFSAVAGLMTVYPAMMRPVRRRLMPDPWRLEPASPWEVRRQWLTREAASLLVISAAAWIVTTPLTAACFNMVSVIALIANLLVVPLSVLVLFTGVLSLVFGAMSVFLAEVFNHANRVFMSAMLTWVDWMARVPGAYAYVKTPPGWVIAVWYIVLILLLILKGIPRRITVGAVCILLLGGFCRWATDDEIRVEILDVGQGGAAFIDLPGSKDLLLDTGPSHCSRDVIRYLRKQGVDSLRALVLSHGDSDHVGGALDILDAIPVAELWCPPFVRQSSLCRQIVRTASEKGIRIRRLERGDVVLLAGGASLEVLHPSGKTPSRRGDDCCLVAKLVRGSDSVLFMNDANAGVEAEMLAQRLNPAAGTLIVGSHGAPGVCSDAWLDAVAPTRAIISVGADNAEGCPDGGVLARLARRGIAVQRTDEEGTITIHFGENSGRSGGNGTSVVSCRLPAQKATDGKRDRF